MTPISSHRRSSVLILLSLAAAAGAALALVMVALAIRVGPWADRKPRSVECQCDGDSETSRRQAQLVDQNGELRRAFLAALARDSGCDSAAPANLPDRPTAPDHLERAAEDQGDVEAPSPEEIVAREQAEVASLQAEFDQQSVDPFWAPVTEQATARAVAATGSMRLEEVTCRESLCRVRVTHRDLAKRDEDVDKLLLDTPPAGGQARVYAPPDEPTTVMYFCRKGMLLSVLAPPVPLIPPLPVEFGEAWSKEPAPPVQKSPAN